MTDIDRLDKLQPYKTTKLPQRVHITDGNLQFDVKGVGHLDSPYGKDVFVNHLSRTDKTQNEVIQVQDNSVTEAVMREQAMQEAKESFAVMMQIRNTLVENYNKVVQMRAQM